MTTPSFVFAHKRPARPRWEDWVQNHHKLLVGAGALLAGLCVVSVVWQMMLPSDRALPLMRIGGIEVGNKDSAAIATDLQNYAVSGEVTITSPNKTWQAKWQSIGVSIDPEASAEAAVAYEQWERFVPFSSPIHMAQTRDLPLVAIVDDDRLRDFATRLVAEDKQAAKDATIHIKDGRVVVDEAKNGYEYSIEDVMRQVRSAPVGTQAKLTLVPTKTLPARQAEGLLAARDTATAMLARTVTLKLDSKEFKPDPTEVGTWLSFERDTQGAVRVVFNNDTLSGYLARLDQQAGIEAGVSTVTLLDGQEIARTPAPGGRTVATQANMDAIKKTLQQNGSPDLTLTVAPAGPRLTYVRTYSQTDAGLLAIIEDWRASHSGDYAVIVRELGGANRYAEVKPDKSYVTASTFKMFVYYAVQQRIQAGTLGYGSMTDMGWTVEDCLEEMIVRSTNPCAIALMNLVGWQTTDDLVHAAGFPNTFLNNQAGGDKFSTIRDETNFMMRLYYGTLLGEEATNRLLGYFKRQIWRAGLPSGVPAGTVVADKVGLYDGWVHDVGIIYGPKSTFIVGIFSRGGNDPAFADLARRTYNFFLN